MENPFSTFIDVLPSDTIYVLVRWPFVQRLMEYDWFRQECYLHYAFDDQAYLPSAYFVPYGRIVKVHDEGDPELFLFFIDSI